MDQTSATLLDRLADRGDSGAWTRLVDLYGPLLTGFLKRRGVSPDDLDDLSQEVLIVVARRLPEFHHNGRPGAFRTWLRAIASNCLRRNWREQRGQPQWEALGPLIDQLEDPDSHASRRWDEEHDRHVLSRLLEALEPEFRAETWQAFRRQAVEGIPAAEVADELGVSVNAVLIAKSRVLRRLRDDASGLLD